MVTLSAVIFWITATLNVASVTVMKLEHDGFMTEAAAFSTLIMLLVTVAMLLMRLVTGYLSHRLGVIGQA
jgi:iron(III) transport system permease protein